MLIYVRVSRAPTLDGGLDHLEFRGLDEGSYKGYKDLFEYSWSHASLLENWVIPLAIQFMGRKSHWE